MAQNYTFNGSLSMTASSATGFTSSASQSFTLNITGVDQIASGRIDVATGSDATIMAAPGYGRAVMVRNLDDTNYVTVYDGALSTSGLKSRWAMLGGPVIERGGIRFRFVRPSSRSLKFK